MSAELLANHHRRAAHGRHQCSICYNWIARGEMYSDQRIADSGTAFTVRSHLACISAYWSWDDGFNFGDEGYLLLDLSGGHLPPCPLAWHHEGVPTDPACACEATP